MQVHRPLRTMEVRDFTRRGFAAINERWYVQRWMVAFERALLLLHLSSTIQFTIATPVFEVIMDAMNHGQYVSSQGGGKTAAHACAGMPLQSNKIKG